MRVMKTGENIVPEDDGKEFSAVGVEELLFLRRDKVGSLHSDVACFESGPWCLQGPSLRYRGSGFGLEEELWRRRERRRDFEGLGSWHSDAHKTDVEDFVEEEPEPRVEAISSPPEFATSLSMAIP